MHAPSPTSSSIFIGLRVGWYASRTLTACLPYALSLHLHAPPAQAMPRSSSSSNELPQAEREISTTSRALVEIMGYSTRSSAALTHKGTFFVSGARACARLSGHACTIRAPHAARGRPARQCSTFTGYTSPDNLPTSLPNNLNWETSGKSHFCLHTDKIGNTFHC